MGIGERLSGWGEERATAWGDRLLDWGGRLISAGTEKIIGRFEPEGVDAARRILTQLRDLPDMPEDVREAIDSMLAPTKLWGLVAAIVLVPLMLIPMVFSVFGPLGNLFRYAMEFIFKSYRFDPMSWITLFRRFPEHQEKFADDLRSQGWTDERIDLLKKITLFYPPPADLIRWQAREVFEPEMVTRYGLTDELEKLVREAFYKAGMDDEQINNYWMAHWEHASWIQVVEMLRRGQLTEEQVFDWYRLVEIPPFWRDKLTAISWNVPTRVDVRRWWDMRTIDEPRLRQIYTAQGYHDQDLEDYVLWTKVYTAWPDLIARWSKGWISLEDVRLELTDMGMPAARVEEMIQTKIKAETPERTQKERDLTKTDIIKGVRQGVITRAEGVTLLVDMNYSEDEAVYLLEVNIPLDEEEQVIALRQLTKSDIIKGLKAEVIDMAEARDRLLELRYSARDSDFLLTIYQAMIEPPTEPSLREASKADIVLAVKKGLLTPEEAYLMLQEIDYSPDAAQFILLVRAESSPFSPRSFEEFRHRTDQWRRAAGVDVTVPPSEIREKADEVVKLTREVASLRDSVALEERTLLIDEVLPEAATERLSDLRVSLHRAQAELARVRGEYDRLIAEWRHRET